MKNNNSNNDKRVSRLISDIFFYNECEPSEFKKPKILPGSQKGLYLTGYSMGIESRRSNIYDIIEKTELNTIVFNVKDDSGYINYDTNNDFAISSNAKIVTYDIKKIISEMDEKGIYSIARIVVFKDPVIAKKHPEMAIKDSRDGSPLYSEGSYWPDIYCEDYWNYIIDIALEISQMGVNEIQFDYIRGPARGNVKFADYTFNKNNITKSEAICNFLKKAKEVLKHTNVKISADIFGFVLIENNDQGIGQMVEEIAPYLDYLYPMLYPSHYSKGFMGFYNPEEHPFEVVKYSLEKGFPKIEGSKCIMIPWLQAFGLKVKYTKDDILSQISASEQLGINGFLFWNASNDYTIVEDALIERYKLKGLID
ncbi:MAG: putative glycoside hydrolase [Actinomycetota bacterium]|nr:putative glycoside hydrolase [Actinomycetota bacterium]